jgi:hypothetical protein
MIRPEQKNLQGLTMNLSALLEAIPSLPNASDWARLLAGVLVLVALGLWLEYRYFRPRGKAGSWAVVRWVSLLVSPVVVLVVLGPARAVSGPMSLAVFYGLLLTVAPLIWVGTHLGVGRLVRPGLSVGECVALASSGSLLLAGPALVVFQLIGPLQAAARHRADNPPGAAATPLTHAVQPLRRWEAPVVGTVLAQSLLAPAGLRLARVDERVGELWEDTAGRDHPAFCSHGADVHLMWAAREQVPHLRLHWVNAHGRRGVAEHRPQPVATDTPASFEVGFRPDGFDLPAPVPRSRVFVVFAGETEGTFTHSALGGSARVGAGESDCVLPGYQRPTGPGYREVVGIALVFRRPGAAPWMAEFARPGR